MFDRDLRSQGDSVVALEEISGGCRGVLGITDSKAHLNASGAEIMAQPGENRLTVGGSSLQNTTRDIKVSTASVNVTGTGPVDIKGAVVEINP